jgi:anthranilate phosphoribosyltransferase
MFRDNLNKIIAGIDLTEMEMSNVMMDIFSGELNDVQVGGFMAALATKGETYEELAGAAKVMRKKAVKIQVNQNNVVDTCGTGGDGLNTFNISTTNAFVVAGAGATVAKHGNRSVSSKCGSADVLEKLGVNLETPPEIVEEAIAEIGIGFLFAPKFHGAMKYAGPARQQLGIRSIFNMIGPLSNPAAADCQLVGVYSPDLTEMFANALNNLGVKRAFVVHGHDGLDEISVCDNTRVSELNNGSVKTYDINPEDYFEDLADHSDLKGGDVELNASITEKILGGEKGPRRNITLINAAAALVSCGKAENLKDGIKVAEESIDSGAAFEKLKQLVQFTNDL